MPDAIPDSILASSETLEAFIAQFLNGTYPVAEWRHRQHVIMAAWHLLRHSETEALDLLRDRIRAYNVAQGGANTETSGYHETLTRFWLRILAATVAQQPEGLPTLDRIRDITEQFGTSTGLFRGYYGFDVVKSVEARREWVPPDLRPMPQE